MAGISFSCQLIPRSSIISVKEGLLVGGQVDPRFDAFYQMMGGKEILGEVISPVFTHNGLDYQYTVASMMEYNPSAEEGQHFNFAPIGRELNITDTLTDPGEPGGHKIYQGFLSTYESMGGSKLVGLPLTTVHYNNTRGGIEQYFENLGFYQLESEPNRVRLIDYGAWMCAEVCDYDSDPTSKAKIFSASTAPFAEAVLRLHPGFIGKPLTEPQQASDGYLEQVFENVVVIEAPDLPGGIALRPIVAMLGWELENDDEIDVPPFFEEYLTQNTGYELSGPPVTEYAPQSDGVWRQCFRNLCLEYYPEKFEGLQIRPVPLGYLYKSKYYQ